MPELAMTKNKVGSIVLIPCAQLADEGVPATREADTSLIEGTVSYESGSPVNGATVYAQPMGRPFNGAIPHATSDERGLS